MDPAHAALLQDQLDAGRGIDTRSPQLLSDASPEAPQPGQQYAQAEDETHKPKDDPAYQIKKIEHTATPEERAAHGDAPLEIMRLPPMGIPGLRPSIGPSNESRPSPALPKPEGIPPNWLEKPTRKGGGMEYINPENPNDRVRVMPGNPNSPHLSQQQPYVKDQTWGRFVDKEGKPIEGEDPGHSPKAHIPYPDYTHRR